MTPESDVLFPVIAKGVHHPVYVCNGRPWASSGPPGPAVHFGEKIFAEILRDDAGGGEYAKVGNGDLWEVGEDSGKRRCRVADESKTNIVEVRPFIVLRNGVNDASVEI